MRKRISGADVEVVLFRQFHRMVAWNAFDQKVGQGPCSAVACARCPEQADLVIGKGRHVIGFVQYPQAGGQCVGLEN